MCKQAIIFLNGDIDVFFCKQYIQNNLEFKNIFCADGSYSKIKNNYQIEKAVVNIIGDFDSFLGTKDCRSILAGNQDFTDFEKLMDFLLNKGFISFNIFGGSGDESDHFINNLSIALKYKKKCKIEFIDRYSKFFFVNKYFEIAGVKNKMISVLPFATADNISYTGLKYPLKNANLELGVKTGIRNYATDDKITIKYESGEILVFVSHDDYKNIK